MPTICFNVTGLPRPKQSFVYSKRGGGYTSARVIVWQDTVAAEARSVMLGRAPLAVALAVTIDFYLPNQSRRDIDNLSKAVLDSLNGIVYDDDNQVIDLHLRKFTNSPEFGCTVTVGEANR